MDAPRITVEDAKKELDSGNPVTFVDVRNPQAWGASDEKLPGALRIPLAEADQHIAKLDKASTIIAYCT